ncbi:MAG: TIGR02679 family protein [Ruminococcus sp.]|jgi:uncharacterized protein (TIGR02679 family)
MEKRLRDECLDYFRERPVFCRLLDGFREKYVSYGKFAGNVVIKNLSEEDREDLEGFLGRNYHGKKSASISAEQFEQALIRSKFEEISGKELLELYFQETMESRKERKHKEEKQWQEMIGRAKKEAMPGTAAAQWLEEIQGPEGENDPEGTWRMLLTGIGILNRLPVDAQYLAVFAAQVTGNPHAFDEGTKGGRYLEQLIRWYLQKTEGNSGDAGGKSPARVFPPLEKQRLFWKVGILKDDVSNYALAAGIRAEKKDGVFHRGLEGFFAEGQPVQIPLSVIAGWKSVCCPQNRVLIVENPSVYAMLCGRWKKNCALLCMNGQPRLSSLLLMDLFAKAKMEVWYAGDFDPEGLLIAQKLKQYYQGEFHYWHMTAADYEKSRSLKKISPRRLKILEKISDEQLLETAAAIKTAKAAGYQENMWEVYLEDFTAQE